MPAAFTRRRFLQAVAGSASVGLLGACGHEEPLLRVGSNLWPGYELMYLAESLKLLDSRRIRMIRMPSATVVMQALAGDLIDAAGLTLDEVLTASANGVKLAVVTVIDQSLGADAVIARPELTSPGALRGKRICVEKTAVGAMMLHTFLRQTGLTPGDVTLIYATVDEHLGLYQSGKADAVVSFNPVVPQLETLGGVRLFDSTRMGGQILDCLAVTERALAQNPLALDELVKAFFAARARFKQDIAAVTPLLAAGLEITPQVLPAAYEGIDLPDLAANRLWLESTPPRLEQSAAIVRDIMLDARLLDATLDVKGLAVSRFLPATTG